MCYYGITCVWLILCLVRVLASTRVQRTVVGAWGTLQKEKRGLCPQETRVLKGTEVVTKWL